MTETIQAAGSWPTANLSGLLDRLIDDYSTKKQPSLIQMKKGLLSRESFLEEAAGYARLTYGVSREEADGLTALFEQYIFGYSRISPLIDDPEVSDIRIVSHDNIRIKKSGRRMDAGIGFLSEKEYRQFVDYVATKNQVNISNLNAIESSFARLMSGSAYIRRAFALAKVVNMRLCIINEMVILASIASR